MVYISIRGVFTDYLAPYATQQVRWIWSGLFSFQEWKTSSRSGRRPYSDLQGTPPCSKKSFQARLVMGSRLWKENPSLVSCILY